MNTRASIAGQSTSCSNSPRRSGLTRLAWCTVVGLMVASACGGDTASDSRDEPLLEEGPVVELALSDQVPADRPTVPGIDPFTDPDMSETELRRFAAAVATLDETVECPPTVAPSSLEGHAEVLRIADGCMHIEYQPLNGRTIWQARAEIGADPTVFAVSLPATVLVPDQEQVLDDPDIKQWHLPAMQATTLWAGWPPGAEVVVAIIDDGVHGNHQDLDANILTTGDPCHRNPNNINNRKTHNDHGTHVAGIIAAEQGNDLDVAGIAPRAKILPIKVHTDLDFIMDQFELGYGETYSLPRRDADLKKIPYDKTCHELIPTIAAAIDLAIESGVDVINVSLSTGHEGWVYEFRDYASGLNWCENDCHEDFKQMLSECLQLREEHDGDAEVDPCYNPGSYPDFPAELYELLKKYRGKDVNRLATKAAAMRGIVVIAAAGNCGVGWEDRPECNAADKPELLPLYPDVVGVAALDGFTDEDGSVFVRIADFTTENDTVDIVAPGKSIVSTVRPTEKCKGFFWFAKSCYLGGTGSYSGSSMAAPMVSGVVAHMRARYPDATTEEITQALFSTVSLVTTNRDHRNMFLGIVRPLDAIAYLGRLMGSSPTTKIAFVSDRSGSGQIYTMNADGSEPMQVTRSSGDNYSPNWSPDGSQIVFAINSGARSHVWITNADGSGSRKLSDEDRKHFSPAWSPDSTEIVVTRPGSRRCGFLWLGSCESVSEIVLMGSGGGSVRRLFGDDDLLLSPSWSPDSERIVYAGEVDGEIFTMDREGGSVRQLTDNSSEDLCPDWSPDGGRIVFASDRDGDFEIYVMGTDGAGQRQLTDNGADDFCPVWSPESSQIAFTSDRDGDREIFVMDADGNNQRQITDNDHDDFQPAFSPKHGGSSPFPAMSLMLVRSDPVLIDAPAGGYSAVSASWDHACGLRTNGAVRCWGNNVDGQSDAPAGTYSAVAAGDWHSCALIAGGAAVCWGNDFSGQASAPEGAFTALAAGWDHTCALSTGGGIECWGSDDRGQTDAPAGSYTAVTAGNGHSCALSNNGTIACWGANDEGQADAPGGSYSAIATGSAHSCAIDTQGQIACWGANWLGQADAPTRTYRAITAGSGHSCATDSQGEVTCWGNNNDEQANPPEGTYSTLAAGRAHTCAIDAQDQLTCWGTLNEN